MLDKLLNSMDVQEPEQPPTDLALDLTTAINDFVQELDLDKTPDNAAVPVPPAAFVDTVKPGIVTKATNDPESVKQALAVIHCETGALLAEHDDRDPEEIAEDATE